MIAGCELLPGGVALPGFSAPGTNQPPIIVAAGLQQRDGTSLRLTANAIDTDADALVITYEQLSGPTAVERTSFRLGGTLDAVIDVPGPGAYAFRIIASDGFFESDRRVSRTIATQTTPFNPTDPVGVGAPDHSFVGRFDVSISGDMLSAAGQVMVNRRAVLVIEPRPAVYAGSNPVVLSLVTDPAPEFARNADGALRLDSAAFKSAVEDDTFDINLRGDDLALLGDGFGAPLAGGAAGQFQPGALGGGALLIGDVVGDLTIQGDTVSGAVQISDATGLVIYTIGLSGVRQR